MTTPIYEAVAEDLGWSPEELGEPFDLEACLLRADEVLRARATVERLES